MEYPTDVAQYYKTRYQHLEAAYQKLYLNYQSLLRSNAILWQHIEELPFSEKNRIHEAMEEDPQCPS